ncbi:MAG: UDP-N-acetylmuramoyl-L-alanyl-D-glutamate--2,6-diaminopimelate ligase [Bacteroidia bacterium]|nr:UDP-N-acetylmuramoyl-L-alanyl-D-glutamate--2,6-diaminopimelate ligase [Bacteroidia bacterium]
MKGLQDILYKVPITAVHGDLSVEITDFFFDSREVMAGSLFVAVRGTAVDGHKYIDQSIGKGAIAVICEEFPEKLRDDVTYVQVKDSAISLGYVAGNYFGNPAREMKVVGVTGTNGKTTTATLLYDLFTNLGYPSGLISTVEIRIGKIIVPATHTTPDAKSLHKTFHRMVKEGCEFCFMEVSSHALVQGRVAGVSFEGGVFTNLTHDHLDFHGDFKEYIRAKKLLFDGLSSSAFALVNLDDKQGKVMLQNTIARKVTYGMKHMADFRVRILGNTFSGLHLEIGGLEVWFRMVGSFNAYNLLAVYSVAVLLGLGVDEILLELSKIQGVNGRFQALKAPGGKFTAIVDYAHTPDALQNVLQTIQDIREGEARIITVVGCGGNRDKAKRPVMGKIAAEMSDQVIFTSDNPRDENPAEIIQEIVAGVPVTRRRRVLTVENRKEAIAVACSLAHENDVILVAGKGHETYQEIKGIKHPFDDRQVLTETFKTLS